VLKPSGGNCAVLPKSYKPKRAVHCSFLIPNF
jgi:hypothetical protein